VFIGPILSNGCLLLSHIVVRITQQRDVYQKSISAGTCLSSRCLAVGRYVTWNFLSVCFSHFIIFSTTSYMCVSECTVHWTEHKANTFHWFKNLVIMLSVQEIAFTTMNLSWHMIKSLIWSLDAVSHSDFVISTYEDVITVTVTVTLQLAVYCQSIRLGNKPLETHKQSFYFAAEHLWL
jgi:hypothetical protein